MSHHTATISWRRNGAAFTDNRYSRCTSALRRRSRSACLRHAEGCPAAALRSCGCRSGRGSRGSDVGVPHALVPESRRQKGLSRRKLRRRSHRRIGQELRRSTGHHIGDAATTGPICRREATFAGRLLGLAPRCSLEVHHRELDQSRSALRADRAATADPVGSTDASIKPDHKRLTQNEGGGARTHDLRIKSRQVYRKTKGLLRFRHDFGCF